jgi:hypothetical protein
MGDVGRDDQKPAAAIAEIDLVEHVLGGRVRPKVIENPFQDAGRHKEAIVLLGVIDPALQLSGPDRCLVDIDDGVVAEVPSRVVDLA